LRIVDASAIAALLFDEAEGPQILARIEGRRLAAPALFGYELANVCQMKCRRQPALRASFLAAYALRTRLAITEYPVDHAEVLALAEATRLTHYDASYLWLARRLDAPLITLDKALLALTPPPASP
jgi:predicted nucleic acid-binding protein